MYNATIAPVPIQRHVLDESAYVLGFDRVLASGDQISVIGPPIVEQISGVTASPLHVSDASPTVADHTTQRGEVIPAGRGVQFAAVGGAADRAYKVTFAVETIEGATWAGSVIVEVRE